MNENQLIRQPRKNGLVGANLLLLIVAFFVIGNRGNSQTQLATDTPLYTITLNEENAPSALGYADFSNGIGIARYVEFQYNNAKRQSGGHVSLAQNGQICNRIDTRISSIQSITAVFGEGGPVTIKNGPTRNLVGNSQTLTSGVEVTFTTNPYFFTLENTGASPVLITSLVITYTCIHTHSTIEFATNGGTAVEPYVLAPGTTIEAPTEPTNVGYVFEGWYTEATFINQYTFSTMPQNDLMLYAKWSVDETIVPLTIAEFKALTGEAQSQLQFVKGIVILASSEIDVTVIADATATLILFDHSNVSHGDTVRVGGYYSSEGDLIAMEPSLTRPISMDVHVYEINLLTPTSMNVTGFKALDPELSSSWVIYANLNGTLSVNMITHEATLTTGTDTMNVGIFSEATLNLISQYDGFRVNILGVILPNMDVPETYLMFLFTGDEDNIALDYDTENTTELAGVLESMFRDYYEVPTYFPGQYLDLPSDHPIITLAITYATYGTNATKFDVNTKRFASDITGTMNIDLHVYVTLYGDPYTFDIVLKVDQSITYVVQGVVTNIQAQGEDNLLLIADETGFVYVNTNSDTIAVGDEIVATGYKMTNNHLVFLYNNPAVTVDHIVATNQSMPLTPVTKTLAEFNALDKGTTETSFTYYELTGTLAKAEPDNPSSNVFLLPYTVVNPETSEIENYYVLVFASSPESRATLLSFVDQAVIVRGVGAVHRAINPAEDFIYLAVLTIAGSIVAAS